MLKTVSSITNAIGALNYKGAWNAQTNTPTLQSGVGSKGDYYVVSVAGTTNLDGITDWQLGDWAIFNGSAWQKIDNTDLVTSVNGQTGVVVLTAPDVGATPNTANVIAGTGLSGGGQLTGNVTLNLANTAVASGTYGNATEVGQFIVDDQGRITNASNVTIAISTANVSGLGTMAVQNANNVAITGGTINSVAQLDGTYTNANITSVATTFPNSYLDNSSATIGNTAVTLGSTVTSLGNVTMNNVTIPSGSINVGVANVQAATGNTVTFATSSLPLIPEGYLTININGANKKIPYYGV